MNKFIQKTKDVFFASQSNILTSTLILSGMILFSRIAGFLRYRILSGFFTKEELDIYFAAFRIPDLVFEVLINGALSTTFIPFFVEFQKRNKNSNNIISSVINAVNLFLLVLIIILVLTMPFIMQVLTPGFSKDKLPELVFYARILLIGQLPFLVLGNFLTGMSQARKSFLIPSIAPIAYNIAIIVFILLFNSQLHIMAPVIGVIVGAFIFFIVQLPVLFITSFRYSFSVGYFKEVRNFFKNSAPRVATIIVAQLDATVDLSLATLLGSGSYTIFYLAQRLQLLPVSLIGMAFGQASLPYLTEVYQQGNKKEFASIVKTALLNIFFFTFPASAFLIIARTPTVRLFFGGDKFDWDATNMTAYTLSFFAISLPLHSAYYFLARSFYAVFDTKTPFYVTAASIFLNAALSLIFTLYLKWPVWSLALSFSISMSIRSSVLLLILFYRMKNISVLNFAIDSIKIALASLNAAIPTYFILRLVDGLILDTTRTINIVGLLITGAFIYLVLYLFMGYIFGVKELSVITKIFTQVHPHKRKATELYKGVETVE